MIYIVPLRKVQKGDISFIGPEFLEWRFGSGIKGSYNLMNFNDKVGLVKTSATLPLPKISKEKTVGFLSDFIDTDFLKGSISTRKLIALAQAYQSGQSPASWMNRSLIFGGVQYGKEEKPKHIFKHVPPLKVKDFTRRLSFWDLARIYLKNPLLLPFFALPATDNFNRANGPLGANWTDQNGSFEITGNTVIPNGPLAGTENGAFWNADTFADDQYAQCTISSNGNGGNGVAARVDTGTNNTWYGFYGYASGKWVFKLVNDSWTQLGAGSGWSAGNTVRIEAEGTTIRNFINGSGTDISDQTDSSIASGAAGITGWGDNAGTAIDNWEGGNLGGAPESLIFPNIKSFQAVNRAATF